ncbi:CCR4-Not complex subunit Mot2 [Schizosaccharomyces japonicus yFS275]|uniref:CCR4-Not complex subunit Mot2 n=1 Tax=Schizosaccharomyces japonicus (strain yFS275 / FY16936) TaxID=402676 RepID=B6K5B3_SCHJY|nr:CCR4-Not complex subunit Mot2 [Schizosaccharomyces japonicus yFS275]EEB08717.1 CCR4-Not complex subunit Mot2 [Schizosaccharomyces japonicus yFS275]
MQKSQDIYSSEDDDDMYCPLCMEEIDISDKNFKPCQCGYRVCRFCWHHIKEDLNGRCPACRRLYTEENVQWRPVTAEEWKMDLHRKNERKRREKERKELESSNRKHLANIRVVQKNLAYVNGLSPKVANEDTINMLKGPEYFGQYGKIIKIAINKKAAANTPNSHVGVYITYQRKEDAARAIAAIDGSLSDGRYLRASYGTTKYCTSYLRNQQCPNPQCMYLHEPGDDVDSYTKEDLATLQHNRNNLPKAANGIHGSPSLANKTPLVPTKLMANGDEVAGDVQHGSANVSHTNSPATATVTVVHHHHNHDEPTALPPTASWAKMSPSALQERFRSVIHQHNAEANKAAVPNFYKELDPTKWLNQIMNNLSFELSNISFSTVDSGLDEKQLEQVKGLPPLFVFNAHSIIGSSSELNSSDFSSEQTTDKSKTSDNLSSGVALSSNVSSNVTSTAKNVMPPPGFRV